MPLNLRIGADLQTTVQAQHHHRIGIDPRPVIGQCRANGCVVAAGHRRLEAEVGGQHLHGVEQLAAAYIEQLLKNQATDIQLFARLATHRRIGGGLHGEIQRTDHDRQQQDQNAGDTRLKTTA